jgi:hypothetical protein
MSKRALIRCGLATLTVTLVTLLVLLPRYGNLRSADHREAPLINEDPAADLADVFAFLNPNDPTKVVFVLTVNGFAVPGVRASYSLSNGVLYQIKIDNTGDAVEDLVIQARFEGYESARDPRCATGPGGQFVTVLGPARPRQTGAANLELDPRGPGVTGCTNQTLTAPGIRVFAGLRDDPFVTDPAQLNRILGGAEQVFRQMTSPVLGELDGRPLVAGPGGPRSGFDTFGGFNVSAIVVEVPVSLVRGFRNRTATYLRTNTTIGFWGTTSRDGDGDGFWTQIQRMGQTLVKTVFIPAAQRDRYNASVPADDLADLNNFAVSPGAPGFSRFVPDALTNTDNDGTGNTIAARAEVLTALGVTAPGNGAPLLFNDLPNNDPNLIRRVIFPDILRIDLAVLPPGDLIVANNGLQNGRRLDDDVTDILVRLARQLADVNFPPGSGVPGSGPPRAGALNCTVLPNCPDRRVLAVLQGTDFIENTQADVDNLANSGQDRPLLADFPFLGEAHPLPGNTTPPPGTVGYPSTPNDPT